MKAVLSVLVLVGFMGVKSHAQAGTETEAPATGEMTGGEDREPAKAHHKKPTKKKKHTTKKHHKSM